MRDGQYYHIQSVAIWRRYARCFQKKRRAGIDELTTHDILTRCKGSWPKVILSYYPIASYIVSDDCTVMSRCFVLLMLLCMIMQTMVLNDDNDAEDKQSLIYYSMP